MKYNTIEYLHKNKLDVSSAIHFTINNIVYLKDNRLHETTISSSHDKNTEDVTFFDLTNRLKDLYMLAGSTHTISGLFDTNEKYMTNLDKVFEDLTNDYHLNLTII